MHMHTYEDGSTCFPRSFSKCVTFFPWHFSVFFATFLLSMYSFLSQFAATCVTVFFTSLYLFKFLYFTLVLPSPLSCSLHYFTSCILSGKLGTNFFPRPFSLHQPVPLTSFSSFYRYFPSFIVPCHLFYILSPSSFFPTLLPSSYFLSPFSFVVSVLSPSLCFSRYLSLCFNFHNFIGKFLPSPYVRIGTGRLLCYDLVISCPYFPCHSCLFSSWKKCFFIRLERGWKIPLAALLSGKPPLSSKENPFHLAKFSNMNNSMTGIRTLRLLLTVRVDDQWVIKIYCALFHDLMVTCCLR